MVTQAYRTAEAGLIAPFEYVGMPMAILWGVVIFGTLPDATAWVGIALICGSGLYIALARNGGAQTGRTMQPEAVIFDIGNVLTHWQPEALL